ncbi:MAG: hypothetical protein MUO40_08495 [Anaerolineaceae bacterium]|nr:hypothetical protein [Anaerolineaceae bacterium]
MLKVTVIGGGSSYTPELIKGFLDRRFSFPLDELCLMDINPERLNIVGDFSKRIITSHGSPFKLTLSSDLNQAISGASYVITQLRVGQMNARRNDEYLGHRHGLIGQETTGIGGLAKALRTIPIILNITKVMQEYAPDGMLVNFTNPAGLITEALTRYAPEVPAVGVCNVAITTKMMFLKELAVRSGEVTTPERTNLLTLGLNHLSWHYGFEVDGVDIWEKLFPIYVDYLKKESDPEFDIEDILRLGMIPNYYLRYFYYTDRMLEKQAHWPPSRAEEVIAIEEELLHSYAEKERHTVPESLMKRGGAWYSTTATQLINAHYNDLDEVHVANVCHKGAVEEYPADWVMELPCRVDRKGVHPIPTKALPDECTQLIAQVKKYEQLTAQAAVAGDRDLVRRALLAHPLGPKKEKVNAVLDDLLETNRKFLPAFFP